MQVENIECQIAQAQIGNFLAGSGLSDEAMSQLEEHISQCSDCKAALSEKRSELRSMLTQDQAVVSSEEIFKIADNHKSAKSIAAALRKKTIEQLSQPATAVVAEPVERASSPVQVNQKDATAPNPANKWKPLGYSVALGCVLVAMSLFSRNFGQIFGPKASDGKSTVAPITAPTEPKVVAENKPTPPPAVVPETTPNPTPTETNTDPVSNTPAVSNPVVYEGLGATTGALATTQFASAETPAETVTPPVVETPKPKTTPVKPVVKQQSPAKSPRKVTRRRATTKRIVRAKANRPRRGITIYQP